MQSTVIGKEILKAMVQCTIIMGVDLKFLLLQLLVHTL